MTKSELHQFFSNLTDEHPENASMMLIDIIMDYFAFPKIETDPKESMVKKHVVEMMSASRNNLIPAVKYVREQLGCGLKEAKDFVELGGFPKSNNTLQTILEQNLESIVDQIKKDYNM